LSIPKQKSMPKIKKSPKEKDISTDDQYREHGSDVYITPLYLEIVRGFTHKRAKELGLRMFAIAKKRWPKAKVEIHPGCEDYVGSFLELGGYEGAQYVPHRDMEMTKWGEGAFLKKSVLEKILIEALEIHRDFTEEELHYFEGAFANALSKRSKPSKKRIHP
jgi:hypothetical protein